MGRAAEHRTNERMVNCSSADLSSTAAADLRETSEANRAMSPGSTTNGRMEVKKQSTKIMTKQNDLTGNARLSNTFCHLLSKDHISQLSIFCIARRAQVLRGRGGTQ